MVSQRVVKHHSWKKESTHDCIQEKQKHEQPSYWSQRRNRLNKGVENDFEVFQSLDHSEHSSYPESSKQSSLSTQISLPEDFGVSKENPSSEDHDEVKHVPAIIEVVLFECVELNDSFHRENYVEVGVNFLSQFREFLVLSIPCQGKHDCVQDNANQDDRIKNIMLHEWSAQVYYWTACFL